MKKFLTLLLTLVVIFAFSSCGGDGGNDAASNTDDIGTDDGSAVEQSVDESGKKAEDVEVIESGYTVSENGYISYGYVIQNKSEKNTYEFHKVIITAYDSNGDVLATDDQMMNVIQPGEKQAYAATMDCNGESPDKVEFKAESGEVTKSANGRIKSSDFEISGVNERASEWDTSITGKVKNNSSTDTNSVGVVVLLKKEGKIVDGDFEFVDNLGAGEEKAFEISLFDVPEHDAYEVTAVDWGY